MNNFIGFFLGTPQRCLATIAGLLIVWGCFHMEQVSAFFDAIFYILVNKVLPIVIVIAIILALLNRGKGKPPAKK